MQKLDTWEKKVGWLAFPGLLRFYALFHVLVFFLQFVSPGITEILSFDREKVFSGEVWRVVTFVFVSDRFLQPSLLTLLFLFFMVMIAFMISDALEGAWGVFKTSLFYYAGYLGLLLGNFIFPNPLPGSGFFIYIASFFAFATLFPKHEFLLFLFIPVQVKWLAMFLGVVLVLGALPSLQALGFLLFSFSNYLIWAGIPAIKGQAKAREASGRRREFESGKLDGTMAFHGCEKCERTEISDPGLEFRMAADGNEYCKEHLPD